MSKYQILVTTKYDCHAVNTTVIQFDSEAEALEAIACINTKPNLALISQSAMALWFVKSKQ